MAINHSHDAAIHQVIGRPIWPTIASVVGDEVMELVPWRIVTLAVGHDVGLAVRLAVDEQLSNNAPT